jgi:hypothetical protein
VTRRSYQRHIEEMSRLGDWHEQYLYMERRWMRHTLPWAVLPSLAGIPVAAAHGLPALAAVAAGAVLAAAFLVLRARWPVPHRWTAVTVLLMLDFWPSVLWLYWWFFPALTVLGFLLIAAECRSNYRIARKDGWLLIPPWTRDTPQ